MSPDPAEPTATTDAVATIDLVELAHLLQDRHGIAEVIVEHTGGGCATLYAGPTTPDAAGDLRYMVCAGPGRIGDMTADLNDFHIGPDDDGQAQPWLSFTDGTPPQTEAQIAEQIAAHIAEQMGEPKRLTFAEVSALQRAGATPTPVAGPQARIPNTFDALSAHLTSTAYAGSDPGDVRYYATYAEAASDTRNLGPDGALWGLDRATGQWQRLTAVPEPLLADVPTYYTDPADTSVLIPPSRLRAVWADLVDLHARSQRPRATKALSLLAYQVVETYAALTGVSQRAVDKALREGRTEPLTDAVSDAISDAEYARRVAALLYTQPLDVPESQLLTVCPECDEVPTDGDNDHRTVPAPTGSTVVVVGCEGYHVVNPALVGMDAPGWHDADGEAAETPAHREDRLS